MWETAAIVCFAIILGRLVWTIPSVQAWRDYRENKNDVE